LCKEGSCDEWVPLGLDFGTSRAKNQINRHQKKSLSPHPIIEKRGGFYSFRNALIREGACSKRKISIRMMDKEKARSAEKRKGRKKKDRHKTPEGGGERNLESSTAQIRRDHPNEGDRPVTSERTSRFRLRPLLNPSRDSRGRRETSSIYRKTEPCPG